MKKFMPHNGLVVGINRPNIDTDAIIPKQYLKSIERTGFGVSLFDNWRYLEETESDHGARRVNSDFVLNQARFEGVSILLARDNFGCGSSREHAVWALTDYGFKVIIAPSFADIFFNNSFKSGLLPIVLDTDIVNKLFNLCDNNIGFRLNINLENQTVKTDEGESFTFKIDEFRKQRLLKGLDDIGITLQYANDIRAYEKNHLKPWVAD